MNSNNTDVHQTQNTPLDKTVCVHLLFQVSDHRPTLCVLHTLWNIDAAASDKFPIGYWTSVPSLAPPQQMSNHPNITAGTEQHSG